MLKQRWTYHSKNGSSRPSNLEITRQKALKDLYAVRLIEKMNEGYEIINIDESWITKNIKAFYSWLTKGRSWSMTNTKFKNSLSLISAIWTNGFAWSAIVHEKVKGTTFRDFLVELSDQIFLRFNKLISEYIIILDNCSVHKWKITKDYFTDKKAKVHFNIPYSPELAPI